VLKEAGAVRDRAVGARRLYSVSPQAVGELRAYFDSFWDTALSGFVSAVEKERKGSG
jgi:hypothetical protein